MTPSLLLMISTATVVKFLLYRREFRVNLLTREDLKIRLCLAKSPSS